MKNFFRTAILFLIFALPFLARAQFNYTTNFGIRSNQFQFTITGTTNIPVVVEAGARAVKEIL
jgi:hypothetical protein